MAFDLKLFQSFLVFGKAKNIVDAAKTLGISQPALSEHLRRVEELLPEKVFVQKGRRKLLTPYGLELHKSIDQRLEGLEDFILNLGKGHLAEENNLVRLAGRREILEKIIVQDLSFKGRIECIGAEGAQVISLLEEGRADIVISSNPPDSLTIAAKPLFSFGFNLVAPKSWDFNSKTLNKGFLEELDEKPFLGYKKNFLPLQLLNDKYSLNLGATPKLLFDDWRTVLDLVEQGRGWTVAPSEQAQARKKLHAYAMPFAQPEEHKFYLVYYKNMTQIAWFKTLVNEIVGN